MSIGNALKKLGKWAFRRLKEPSTYVGVSMVAVALGKPEVAEKIGSYGQIATILLGTGIAAATTSQHTPIDELPLKDLLR
jgi:hypothetical protein